MVRRLLARASSRRKPDCEGRMPKRTSAVGRLARAAAARAGCHPFCVPRRNQKNRGFRRSDDAAGSKPALLPRQPERLDAIADAELPDRLGKIIAYRAVRKIEPRRDVAGRKPF